MVAIPVEVQQVVVVQVMDTPGPGGRLLMIRETNKQCRSIG